ncbi:MAG: DOMON domain-containing protein [Candidatus Bipolaricaulota bacterium]
MIGFLSLRRALGALLLVLLLAGATSAQTTSLSLIVSGFGDFLGTVAGGRLLDAVTGLEIARAARVPVDAEDLTLAFAEVPLGREHILEIVVDSSRDGELSRPPADTAFRVVIAAVSEPTSATLDRPDPVDDVFWPAPFPFLDGAWSDGEYPHTARDAATGMSIAWWNDATVLIVAMTSPGTGWVSVGLDPESAMQGADYILAAVSSGELRIEDHFGTSRFGHAIDAQSDVLAAAGRELERETTVEFAIPLDSGDPADKPLRSGSTYEALLAYHASSDDLSVRHSDRGAISLALD